MKTIKRKTKEMLFYALSIALFSPAILYSQDVTEREISEFSKLDAGGAFNVMITQAPTYGLEIESQEVNQEDVITIVEQDVLKLDFDGSIPRKGKVVVKITTPKLESIKASGVANVETTNTIKSETMKIDFSGASKLNMSLETEKLESRISGASNVTYSGKASVHNVVIGGASFLKAFDLESEVVDVKSSGATKVEVNATDKISGSLSGTSELIYKAGPETREIATSGVATVGIKEDDKIVYYDSKDTVRIKLGEREVWLMDESRRTKSKRKVPSFRDNWEGIDIGMNAYLTPSHSLSLDSEAEYLDLELNKSWVINFNVYQRNFPVISNNFGFYTGIGFGWNNYRLNDRSVTLQYDQDEITYKIEDDIRMSRNKFVLFHLNIPLMMEVQTHGDRRYQRFNLAVGGNLGILMSSYTRQKYDLDGNTMRRKVKENYHVNPFRYDATVRIGYAGVNLFATYALNTLFRSGKGPELHPFSVGITLTH